MRLEGTLDAFSLPDIFQLLSFTKKTGTLHLRRDAAHGAVHLRDGAVTGARADVSRQELGRRLLGSGLVDDESLALAAEELTADPDLSLAQLLAEKAELAADAAVALAAEQAHDAVFSLLRWPEGEFAFVVDEVDPDDLGAALPVQDVVTEGQRRIIAWGELLESVPAPEAVVRVNPAPAAEPVTGRDEWALLSLVDGRRTVTDLVTMSGRGEFATVSALAGLVSRGLLVVGEPGEDQLARRQSLLSALEGRPDQLAVPDTTPAAPEPEAARPAVDAVAPVTVAPAAPARSTPVIPERIEPFSPPRQPEHAEVYARASRPVVPSARTTGPGAHGSVQGAHALQPEPLEQAAPAIERDPSVNKSLLLRLIAGVRGL